MTNLYEIVSLIGNGFDKSSPTITRIEQLLKANRLIGDEIQTLCQLLDEQNHRNLDELRSKEKEASKKIMLLKAELRHLYSGETIKDEQ